MLWSVLLLLPAGTATAHLHDCLRLLLGKATAVFQELSGTVRQIGEQLQTGCSRPDLAALLRDVQEQERSKLQFTMSLQVGLCFISFLSAHK